MLLSFQCAYLVKKGSFVHMSFLSKSLLKHFGCSLNLEDDAISLSVLDHVDNEDIVSRSVKTKTSVDSNSSCFNCLFCRFRFKRSRDCSSIYQSGCLMASTSRTSRSTLSTVPAVLPTVTDEDLGNLPEPAHTYTQEELCWRAQVTRPAGIQSLAQWGQVVLEDGKHKGKTHEVARVSDPAYERFVCGRTTFTAQWSKNMRMYCVAVRRKATEGRIRNMTAEEYDQHLSNVQEAWEPQPKSKAQAKAKSFAGAQRVKAKAKANSRVQTAGPVTVNEDWEEDEFMSQQIPEVAESLIEENPTLAAEALRVIGSWSHEERVIMLHILRQTLPSLSSLLTEEEDEEEFAPGV